MMVDAALNSGESCGFKSAAPQDTESDAESEPELESEAESETESESDSDAVCRSRIADR